ncbi:hypothetical protein L2E82_32398 [Cichorium intybus]|uniref:Uncharacterized protein n=1 Tax=Cichorium intybus TaxID=13427 RepID=A0ACB9BHG9_CICIN|nr:hypothetical protein L2E82_32398 [Cichorium intybus]
MQSFFRLSFILSRTMQQQEWAAFPGGQATYLGNLVPEALGLGNWVKAQERAALPGGQATYLGNPVPWGTLTTILKYPGGAFDPLDYSKDTKKFEEYKVKEIKNGRLALLAFGGVLRAAIGLSRNRPIGEFGTTHLADPWHNNIGDVIIPKGLLP